MKQFNRRFLYRQRGKRRKIINVYVQSVKKESFALIEGLQKFKEDLETKIYIQ